MASKYVSNEVRLSYVTVFEPRSVNGSDPKYSVTILMPKSDTEGKARLDAAIEAARQDGLQRLWNGICPPNLPVAVHDGDGVRQSGEPFGAECKGHWVLTASSKNAPEVVDEMLNPILEKTSLYSGCFGRVGLNPFAYNSNGRKGISFGLNTVQKLRDGDPLGGGRVSAADDFGAPAGGTGYQPPRIDPVTGLPIRG